MWFPEYCDNEEMVVGKALIEFKTETGKRFTVTHNYFFSSYPLRCVSEEEDKSSISPFKTGELFYVDYTPLPDSLRNNEERIYLHKKAPFFFADVDYDGKDELVLTNYKQGQNSSNSYQVYSLLPSGEGIDELNNIGRTALFADFDDFTAIYKCDQIYILKKGLCGQFSNTRYTKDKNNTFQFDGMIRQEGDTLFFYTSKMEKEIWDVDPLQRLYYNRECYCLRKGNIFESETQKGNFFKSRSIGDSMYVWSCGRGEIEKIIDTLSCLEYNRTDFDWETDEFVALHRGCGTYCWTNTIIPIKTNQPIMRFSYLDIDFDKMNVVEIGMDSFYITNLKTQKNIEIPIDGIECIEGYTLFFISDVELKNNNLFYSVICKDGSKIKKQIKIKDINLLY